MTTDPELLRINKVIDDDMNEIKQVVNDNDDILNEANSNLNAIIPIINTESNSGTIKIGKVGIEWGVISINPNGNGYASEPIVFSNVYKNSPAATACANIGTSAITNVGVFGVSTTGMSIFLVASGSTSRSIRYLVIGELNSEEVQETQEAQS